MKKIFFSGKELWRVLGKNNTNLKKIEKRLNVGITETQGEISIQSKSKGKDAIIEYLTLKIIEALALGFAIETTLHLSNTDYSLMKIDIKSYAKGKRVNVIKGRIIGTKGKTKALLERLSECNIVLSDHTVGIIGKIENVELASQAIYSLIKGKPQSKVYGFLERSKVKLKEELEEVKEIE